MALSSSTTTPFLTDRAATKLGAGLRSRQGLTPAAQNVGSAAARAQRAFGAGLKSSQENVKPLGKPTDLKKQNVGALRLHSVIMENAAPKSAQRSKGHKKRPRGLKHMSSQQQDGGFLTPARPNAGAATHVQGKMRVFTDQSSVFSRRRRAVTPARTAAPAPVSAAPTPAAAPSSENSSGKERSGESSSDDMDLTDNESCTIEPSSNNMRPLRNVRPARTFTSPPRSGVRQKSPVRAKSPSLRGAVHPVGPRAQDFDRTRSIWERRESLASKPSEGDDELGAAAPLVTGIVAPSLPGFDAAGAGDGGGMPGGLVAAPRTITALNKTKSITAAYTTAVNRALSPKTSATNNPGANSSQPLPGHVGHSTRLAAARRSLRGVGANANRVRTRVSALNSGGSTRDRTPLAPLSPTRSPSRTKATRPMKGRMRHYHARGNIGKQHSRWDRRRASQQSSKSDASDDSLLLDPEFVFPMPGSDVEKKLRQAIQGASVYEGFDKEEIETLTQLKRMISEIVAPSLSAYDIPDEELERLLTDYSTTSTATTWSTRTVDTEDPAFYEDSDDDQDSRAYAASTTAVATDVPEHISYLTGLTENLNIEFAAQDAAPVAVEGK